MSVSTTNRDPSGHCPAPHRPRTDSGDSPAPRFSHAHVDNLEVPQDCDASAILKLVDRDAQGRPIYAFWLVVGRYGDGTIAASYKPAEDDIRVDIPTGASMSSAALLPHLEAFTPMEAKPPTIIP